MRPRAGNPPAGFCSVFLRACMANRTVLVADDESHMTYILSYKLQQLSLDVLTANDGLSAYAIACERRPDLIITDFQMPGMSGPELCAKLRDTPATSHIPVILVTARGHRLDLGQIGHTNIQHIIAKPFSARDLLAKVQEILSAVEARSATPATPGASVAGAGNAEGVEGKVA